MRYLVQWAYRTGSLGPWFKGDEVDLREDVAEAVNRDSPGVLVPVAVTKVKAAAKGKGGQEPGEGDEPAGDGQDAGGDADQDLDEAGADAELEPGDNPEEGGQEPGEGERQVTAASDRAHRRAGKKR